MYKRILAIVLITFFISISVSFGQNLELVGQYLPEGDNIVGSFDIMEQYAYFISNYGMGIVNIANPQSPEFTGRYDSEWLSDIEVIGNYAYILSFNSLYVIDISDPGNPDRAGQYNYVNGYNFFIYSHYAFLSSQVRNSEIVDISDSDSLIRAGYFDTLGPAIDFFVVDSLLYVADLSAGLTIYNLSIPISPVFIGSISFGPNYVESVTISGNYAYCICTGGILKIVDISDPTQPLLVGSYMTAQSAFHCCVSGVIAIISEGIFGLELINISDPSEPYFVTNFDTPGSAGEMITINDYIYVSDMHSLLIFRLNPTNISVNANPATEFATLQTYPNPFNASTTISYSLQTTSKVTIEIFDIIGRKIETVASGLMQNGYHQAIWEAGNQASGIYFCMINSGDKSETQKMILLK